MDVEIQAVLVVNADCIPQPAMDLTSRVHQFLGLDDIPIALSRSRAWNPFPWGYRSDCITMGNIDALSGYKSKWSHTDLDAETVLASILDEATEPVTILCVCPITPLINVITEKNINKVGDIIWMGGTINVHGNLVGGDPQKTPTTIPGLVANKHAEWNIFYDPFASSTAFEKFSNIKLFPLDITNYAGLTQDFITKLSRQAKQGHKLSNFALQSYEICKNYPYYRMWDTCATCCLAGDADMFSAPEPKKLSIETWGNDMQGGIVTDESANTQDVYMKFKNSESFYNYVLQQLRCC